MEDQVEENWQISESDLQYHQRIGDGANGEVYLVTLQGKDGRLKEAAAKKITSKTSESDEESKRDRTHDEVDILRKLKHPNIIQFFCAVLQPMIIIVTEYAAQGSLYSYLKVKTKLPPWQRNNWMHQAASAVQYLHQHDIVHLDVKSNNFVIMQNGILKLCDFGTATSLVWTEETDCAKGTIPWMAPEIIGPDMLISKSSDVFSLGVVIWELITCEIPYDGSHPHFIQYQVVLNGLRPAIPENCPYDVKMLLQACWEDDRKRRPKIDEVIDAINRIVRLEGTRSGNVIMRTSTLTGQAVNPTYSSTEEANVLQPPECLQSFTGYPGMGILAGELEASVDSFVAEASVNGVGATISNIKISTEQDGTVAHKTSDSIDAGESNHGYESDAANDTVHPGLDERRRKHWSTMPPCNRSIITETSVGISSTKLSHTEQTAHNSVHNKATAIRSPSSDKDRCEKVTICIRNRHDQEPCIQGGNVIMRTSTLTGQAVNPTYSSTEEANVLQPPECLQSFTGYPGMGILAGELEASVDSFVAEASVNGVGATISNIKISTEQDGTVAHKTSDSIDAGESNHGYESDAANDTVHPGLDERRRKHWSTMPPCNRSIITETSVGISSTKLSHTEQTAHNSVHNKATAIRSPSSDKDRCEKVTICIRNRHDQEPCIQDNNDICGHPSRICLVVLIVLAVIMLAAIIFLSSAFVFVKPDVDKESKLSDDCHIAHYNCSTHPWPSICTPTTCDKGYMITDAVANHSCQIHDDLLQIFNKACIPAHEDTSTVMVETVTINSAGYGQSAKPPKTDGEQTTLADIIFPQQSTDNRQSTHGLGGETTATFSEEQTTPHATSIVIGDTRSEEQTTSQQIPTKVLTSLPTELVQRSELTTHRQTTARLRPSTKSTDLIEDERCYFNITTIIVDSTEATATFHINDSCSRWIITVPDGFMMELNITSYLSFDDDNRDRVNVTVRDGPDKSSQILHFDLYSNSNTIHSNQLYESTGNYVWINTNQDLKVVVTYRKMTRDDEL